MNKYIATDTETGGIGPEFSLLTAYFAVLDENFNFISDLDLKLKHDVYHITPEAMAINKIDLIEHDKVAIHKSEAGQLLRNFLIENSNKGEVKLIPLGHGIAFDVNVIWNGLLGRAQFETYCSYRRLCTAVIAQYLKDMKVIPDNVSGSLSSLAEYYGLSTAHVHDAKFDTMLSVDIYRKMLGRY